MGSVAKVTKQLVSHLKTGKAMVKTSQETDEATQKLITSLQEQSKKLDTKKPSWMDKKKKMLGAALGNMMSKILDKVKASVKKWLKAAGDKSAALEELEKASAKAEKDAQVAVADISKTSVEVITIIKKHLENTALAGFFNIDEQLDAQIKVAQTVVNTACCSLVLL